MPAVPELIRQLGVQMRAGAYAPAHSRESPEEALGRFRTDLERALGTDGWPAEEREALWRDVHETAVGYFRESERLDATAVGYIQQAHAVRTKRGLP